MSALKLSPSQLRMLRNIADGKAPTDGISGRSAHGGAAATFASLHRHGLVSGMNVTAAGRQALAGAKA